MSTRASAPRTDVVEVLAWGRRVGAVARNPATGLYAFAYAPGWIPTGIELSPLRMPLRPEPYEFPDLDGAAAFVSLPPLLADSLPDAFGTRLVDAWMAAHGVAEADVTPLARLAFAADRAMGALEFRPPLHAEVESTQVPVSLADLVVAARLAVRGELGAGTPARAAVHQLIQVGSRAGGARAKALVSFNPDTWQLRSPDAPPAEGFEPWLCKLDGVSAAARDDHGDRRAAPAPAPQGRIEYAYSLMAGAAGVEMSPCRLLAEGPRRHFMTRRFDRAGPTGRLHMISLCALAHLDYNLVATHSYDQYLLAVRALGLGAEDVAQAYRRMVFNVLAVNHDDHTKNFAFLRAPEGGWRLAPAFDVTYAYRRDSKWTSRHLMGVNGKYDGITEDDLFAVGERHDVPGWRRIVSEVRHAVAEWPAFAAAGGVTERATERIAAAIARAAAR